EVLKKTWRLSIYSFFKPDITLQYYKGRPYHYFICAAPKCKTGGVHQFQDSKDKSSTGNLRYHATCCFSEDAVLDAAATKKEDPCSIHSLFAHHGKQPVRCTIHAYTNSEIHAHIVRWITANNHPLNIINDRELRRLLTAGQLNAILPSPDTISQDISAAFEKCQDRIAKLLQEYNGRLHFATDAWTSLNHCAFAAWTVHLSHGGEMLSFLLDINELSEVHHFGALSVAANTYHSHTWALRWPRPFRPCLSAMMSPRRF
ncbi:hypothetical protein BJV78DRAFT_1138365, partial [Lactifluus subvellereus]